MFLGLNAKNAILFWATLNFLAMIWNFLNTQKYSFSMNLNTCNNDWNSSLFQEIIILNFQIQKYLISDEISIILCEALVKFLSCLEMVILQSFF